MLFPVVELTPEFNQEKSAPCSAFVHVCIKKQMLSSSQGEYIASAKGLQLEVYFFKKQKAYRWETSDKDEIIFIDPPPGKFPGYIC